MFAKATVEALGPGEELNELIAVWIMGEACPGIVSAPDIASAIKNPRCDTCDKAWDERNQPDGPITKPHQRHPKPYSTNIELALRVLQRVPGLDVVAGSDGSFRCYQAEAGGEVIVIAEGQTKALAICRGALLSVPLSS